MPRVMLADPGFSEPQVFCPDNQLDVFFETLGSWFFRGVHWHHEQTQFHRVPFSKVA